MSTAAVTMSAVLSALDDESWSWTRSLWRFPDQVFSPSLGDLCKSWSCWVGFATEFEVLTCNLKCLGSFSGGRYAGVVWSCVWITAAHKRGGGGWFPQACPSSCVGPVVYGKLETTENKTLCAVGARNLGVKLEIVDTTAAPALYIVGR